MQTKAANDPRQTPSRVGEFLRSARPALITGGAGDDPAGVLTYTTVGATTGFTQLWLLIFTTPMLVAAVSMADRIARTTGAGLAAVLRERHGRVPASVVMALLVIANVAVISADVSAVGEVLQILTGIPWEWFVPLILLLLLFVLRIGYARARSVFAALALGLLVYAVAAVMAHPQWEMVLPALVVPHVSLSRAWLLAALGLIGATVSPYMLFWQGDEQVEEARLADAGDGENAAAIWAGMIFSNLISVFIIIAAAVALHDSGAQITTVFDAAKALSPLGRIGDLLFVVGILGAGLLALPVFGASSAYAVAEVFAWSEGLGEPVRKAVGFYVVVGAALLGGALISILPKFNPADALFYSQVLNGVLVPLIMVVLLKLSNDPQVTGRRPNPAWINIFGVVTIVVALAASVAALFG